MRCSVIWCPWYNLCFLRPRSVNTVEWEMAIMLGRCSFSHLMLNMGIPIKIRLDMMESDPVFFSEHCLDPFHAEIFNAMILKSQHKVYNKKGHHVITYGPYSIVANLWGPLFTKKVNSRLAKCPLVFKVFSLSQVNFLSNRGHRGPFQYKDVMSPVYGFPW